MQGVQRAPSEISIKTCIWCHTLLFSFMLYESAIAKCRAFLVSEQV